MHLHRPPRPLLAALAVAGAVAACAGAGVAGAPAATTPPRILPVPSPLPVPPVLELAAQRLEAQADRSPSRPVARPAPRTAPRAKQPSTQTVHPVAPAHARTDDPAIVQADVLANGIALPPLQSPPEVRAIIEAGNAIARTPYKWGGGHGRWQDTGYDCSGSVSFALASASLLDAPMASGPLMSWGEAGPGRWITIYASPTHVFMVVAGVRFDTGGTRVTGSRWQASMRSTAGFAARHPAGL